jgi:predicted flap endonuclease-1-like 5' DNA nuclease
MYKLIEIDGIGARYAKLLHEEGLNYQEQFLDACFTRSRRSQLCKHKGINPKLILKWTNHADLARIHGIGEEFTV